MLVIVKDKTLIVIWALVRILTCRFDCGLYFNAKLYLNN